MHGVHYIETQTASYGLQFFCKHYQRVNKFIIQINVLCSPVSAKFLTSLSIQSDVAETARIIWSYDPSDPSNPTDDLPMPTNRGSRSLNLVGRLQNERSVPPDAATFTIRNNNASHR